MNRKPRCAIGYDSDILEDGRIYIPCGSGIPPRTLPRRCTTCRDDIPLDQVVMVYSEYVRAKGGHQKEVLVISCMACYEEMERAS